MPGIVYARRRAGMLPTPDIRPFILANSLTGIGSPPAAAVKTGDLVALTTASALTASGAVVVRMLLAADKTAHYLQGTPVAGILGVAMEDVQTNATGVAGAPPPLGGVTTSAAIPYPLSGPAMQAPESASGRSQLKVAVASVGMVFQGAIDMAAGAVTLTDQYNNTLAGFILNTTGGITTYTVHPGAAAADQCIRILGPNFADPLYNTLVAQNAALGPTVFFEFLGTFEQASTGVNYSSQ